MMLKKSSPLQSRSEIALRNIVVAAMIVFYVIFLIIPIGIALAGSFHEWNPLNGTYRFLGIENYINVFTSGLFWKSMYNTLIFFGSSNYFQSRTWIRYCLCHIFCINKA